MTDEIQDAEVTEIEDSRTGEEIPRGIEKYVEEKTGVVTHVNANSIGTLDLDEQAEKVLAAPLKPTDVKIRPDGLVYLPWTYYAEVLNRAFGKLKWGIIPQGSPQSKEISKNEVLVVWGFWLVVKGVPVSFAVGETSYRTNNRAMSYGDAVEGAKSSSLARNCKQLGVSLELWDAEWVDAWKAAHAHKIKNPNGNYPEYIWVRKDDKRYSRTPKAKTKTEPLPSGVEKGVDEAFPPEKRVTKEEVVGKMPVNKLRDIENVKAIKAATERDIPAIMEAINGLDKNAEYSLKDVINILKEEKSDEQ